ncbi:AraC family transcriptional regulator [Agrobacterium tumefaciens]|uniref:AraC family transcriptional regulator n=1 Tax=Agrobacterium tumefaciens TaxID=358 RepID=UPI0015729895|nr:helix-turn-helix transcriptional regulator [Agrobacterium tumefaciens]NTD87673.1 helix-turn-helix transcriptional regulator [Agrobacterium tumefaciens]NTD91548.1 helix-turn-helix transcriptional regulator [Agrobacterium tumefaciens]NTD95533.1 helix-turn-helix transcriptional regulator [Agrobacterium tumefaciens]NTE11643.1 helix-turn-helix transcriptional regulator [Agrobacterium tumefaciens]NTE25088.1 helix-turn-helix transcriptional regulator [Agrobacterium tumefaciens]
MSVFDIPVSHHVDPDMLRHSLVTLGMVTVTDGWRKELHSHRRGALIFNVKGLVTCEADGGLWMVPPQCAVWIPGGVMHAPHLAGDVECYTVFIEPERVPSMLQSCATIHVTPLMKELILRTATFPEDYALGGPEDRVVQVLVDELSAASEESLFLPMPASPKLRSLASMMVNDPSDKASLGQWASRIGLSERTLSRFLMAETGMSFGRWRRQLHILVALKRLSAGDTVQNVAFDLGYESSSGFVTMFRKVLGKPPGRYLHERNTGKLS